MLHRRSIRGLRFSYVRRAVPIMFIAVLAPILHMGLNQLLSATLRWILHVVAERLSPRTMSKSGIKALTGFSRFCIKTPLFPFSICSQDSLPKYPLLEIRSLHQSSGHLRNCYQTPTIMSQFYHAKTGEALKIPVPDPTPVLSFSSVTIPFEGRPVSLTARVNVPTAGSNLPVIVLSHGLGRTNYISSQLGYTPLSEFYAARGFVVVQPTHLDSAFLGIPMEELSFEARWEARPADVSRIIDELDLIEGAVPTLAGRMDKTKIGVVGHSFGAIITALLLGAKNVDPRNGKVVQVPDGRITAGITLAGAGKGGDALNESGQKVLPFYNPDFSTMTTPALVVVGEKDEPHFATATPAWYRTPFEESPGNGNAALLEVSGGKHCLGGVGTWDAVETGDEESPERLGVVQRMTWAYMKWQLCGEKKVWEDAVKALGDLPQLGKVEMR